MYIAFLPIRQQWCVTDRKGRAMLPVNGIRTFDSREDIARTLHTIGLGTRGNLIVKDGRAATGIDLYIASHRRA